MSEPKRKPWTMPAWMEPFREDFTNTGGNSVERLLNGTTDARVNLPLAVLEACAQSQVLLLDRLHRKGRLT